MARHRGEPALAYYGVEHALEVLEDRCAVCFPSYVPTHRAQVAMCLSCDLLAVDSGEGRWCENCQDHCGTCNHDHCLACGGLT